jgi:uncharacterized RDD family membrane protein YckC
VPIAGVVFILLNPLLYTDDPSVVLFNVLGVAGTIGVFVYMILFDGGERGATPGKRILGIRVADARTGGPIGYRRAATRRLWYAIGGLLLFAGWWWALFDPRRRTWHDRFADSVVITTAKRVV